MRQTDMPQPFAVLFAQTLIMGTAFVVLAAAGLGLLALAARFVHTRGDSRYL